VAEADFHATRLGPASWGVLVSLAYVLGTHWLMTRGGGSPWSVVGVLSPMLSRSRSAPGAAASMRSAPPPRSRSSACAPALRGVVISPPLYLAQHVGIHAFLAVGFGRHAARRPTRR